MTKSELVDHLSAQLGMPKAQVRRMVDAMVDTITQTLVRGEKVQLSGLGTFEVRRRNARPGRDPQKGTAITISARNVVHFGVAKPLKEAVK